MAAGRRRRGGRNGIILLLGTGILCLTAVSGTVWGRGVQETPLPGSPLPAVQKPLPEGLVEPNLPLLAAAGLASPPAPFLPPEETAEPVDLYDYSQPVPESAPAPEDYFADAAFVGDSRTDGLLLYSGIKGATGLSYKGLTVLELEDKRVKFTISGVTDTVMGALEKERYGKVYIMLGVNELGWNDDPLFYNTYVQSVRRVKELQPDAIIYLQAILPVTKKESEGHPYFTNENILRYNEMIARIAAEEQVYYLDVGVSVMGEDGALPEEGSTDGIHLKRDYYKRWYEYLKNHIIPAE